MLINQAVYTNPYKKTLIYLKTLSLFIIFLLFLKGILKCYVLTKTSETIVL